MDRLVFWIYKGLRAVLRALPLPVVFRLGQFAGLIGYYLAPPYRALAESNLQIAFGRELPASERRELAREHFRTLIANLFCSLAITAYSKEQILALAELSGMEPYRRLIEQKRGCLFVLSHMGNWELLAQLVPALNPVSP